MHRAAARHTLKYAFVGDAAARSVADADVTGTWNGASVMIDADDPCGGIYGALFTEPVTGAWYWAEPHDDSLW